MYDKSLAIMQKAVALAPDNPQILLNMGAVYAQAEHFTEAAVWMEKALAKDPNFINAIEHLAGVKTSLKKFEEAIDMCRRIMALRPGSMLTIPKLES